jgi:diacylglycerol kinase (ATP)
MKNSNSNNGNLFTSVSHAWRGIAHALETERNFRVEVAIAMMIIPLAIVLPLSNGERAGVFLFVVLVLFAELVNTSVERMVDLFSPEHHALAGAAKDVVAGSVLIVGVGAIVYTVVVAYNVWGRIVG